MTTQAYKRKPHYSALQSGGVGHANAWAIIDSENCDFEGKIVIAFMNITASIDVVDHTAKFTAVTEEISGGDEPVLDEKGETFLAQEYPFGIVFEGRYTELIPEEGYKFKIWFML